MNSSESKQLVIGLPETGKTTFLAALWHVLRAGDIPVSLKLKEFPAQRNYILDIASDWVSGRPVGRTVIGAETEVCLKLEVLETGRIVETFFPDISGEIFYHQFAERQWENKYDVLVSNATGILLFIYPEKVAPMATISDANLLVEELGENGDDDSNENVVWSADLVPTQVQLVDLLQLHINHTNPTKIRRVAVIVSAWDTVQKYNPSAVPDAWLKAELPLLHQYLISNARQFSSLVYGVSALGGSLEDDAERLLSNLKPAERIIIIGNDCKPHDITAPITWLLQS